MEAKAFCQRLNYHGRNGSLATVTSPDDILIISKFADDMFKYATGFDVPSFIWLDTHAMNTTAKAFCQRLNYHGRNGSLATVTSPDDILFISKFADDMFKYATGFDVPSFIWLDTHAMNTTVSDLEPILDLPFGQTSDVTPCENNQVVDSEVYQVVGTAQMVPGPGLVEQPCAVHAPLGSFLDLGDFAGSCVSDPGLCESESVTWSIWLKIDTPVSVNKDSWYYLSSGGQTGQARGIAFAYKEDTNTQRFLFTAKSEQFRVHRRYDKSKIPLDEWFHLAFTADLSDTRGTDLQLFVNGETVNADVTENQSITQSDGCTHLYIGMSNTCAGTYSVDTYGGSAAYSNLVVFDGLLGSQQIANLYKCGSIDWRPRIINFTMTHYGITDSAIRFNCTADGDVITWSLLHESNHNNMSSEHLEAAAGAGYTIQAVNASRCVIHSTLEIDLSHGLPLEGALVACTAHSYRLRDKVSMFIYQGKQVNIGTSDHGSIGLSLREVGNHEAQFIIQDGDYSEMYCDSAYPTTASNIGESCSEDQQNHPFICQM
ncbi:uncharacterized protein LOC119725443 [Patiria miniata]|uniref:Uncharacterized protein n=1 Tax=Patiria miniata TaxID=46514 RepID=A0A913ZLV1_PATMI|nr:uncharacterized protein LOC119725443 [Patiria miniata]